VSLLVLIAALSGVGGLWVVREARRTPSVDAHTYLQLKKPINMDPVPALEGASEVTEASPTVEAPRAKAQRVSTTPVQSPLPTPPRDGGRVDAVYTVEAPRPSAGSGAAAPTVKPRQVRASKPD